MRGTLMGLGSSETCTVVAQGAQDGACLKTQYIADRSRGALKCTRNKGRKAAAACRAAPAAAPGSRTWRSASPLCHPTGAPAPRTAARAAPRPSAPPPPPEARRKLITDCCLSGMAWCNMPHVQHHVRRPHPHPLTPGSTHISRALSLDPFHHIISSLAGYKHLSHPQCASCGLIPV